MKSRNKMHLMVNSFVSMAIVVFLAAIVTTVVRAEGIGSGTYMAHKDVTSDKIDTSFDFRRLLPRSYSHSVNNGMYGLQLQGIGARFHGKRRGDGGMDIGVKLGYPSHEQEARQSFDTRFVTPDAHKLVRDPVGGPLFMFSIGKRW